MKTLGHITTSALVILLASGAQALAQTAPVVARAASVTGRAIVFNAGAAPFGLSAGVALNPGDRIDTRGGGRVVIDLSDGSMVVVEPESLVILKDFQQASSLRELFEIAVGLVRVKINHFSGKPNPYRMNSPTASIAVRGTEFSIEVSPSGDTQVVVYEGAVEVSSLSDPDRKTLIEAGRGVLVQPGRDFRFFNNFLNRAADIGDHNDPDRDHRGPPPPMLANTNPGGSPATPTQPGMHAGQQEPSSRTSFADVAQVPFLYRYNAFAEPYLDSLENPAYATDFVRPEGRLYALPSTLGPSPQISMFVPVHGVTLGGSASATSGGALNNFYSAALLAARRSGPNSLGVELEALKETDPLSYISQARLTLGYSRDFSWDSRLGLFYRHGSISAVDAGHAATSGLTSELGLRWRGAITPRLSYGVTAGWLGISFLKRDHSHRSSLGFGLGYSLTRRVIASFDLAGGAYRSQDANGRFVSSHTAVQAGLTRRLFVSASLLNIWACAFPTATRFSDFGAGWRFSPGFFAQYLYSTAYGASPASHTLLLRYTFNAPAAGPRAERATPATRDRARH